MAWPLVEYFFAASLTNKKTYKEDFVTDVIINFFYFGRPDNNIYSNIIRTKVEFIKTNMDSCKNENVYFERKIVSYI